MIQDLRHLVILDFRDEGSFQKFAIRDTFFLSMNKAESWKQMIAHFKQNDSKATQYEMKYKSKKIRRVIIIADFDKSEANPDGKPPQAPKNIQDHYATLHESCKSHDITMDKFYYLNDYLANFEAKFPFLC